MEDKPLVRRAMPTDAAAVRDIAAVTWRDTYVGIIPESVQDEIIARFYHPTVLADQMVRAGSVFLVAERPAGAGESDRAGATSGHNLVAFCQATRLDDRVEVDRLYVLPGWQGRGIGRTLLETAIALAVDADAGLVVTVNAEAENKKARAFYERLGFVAVGEERWPAGEVDLPIIVYARRLG